MTDKYENINEKNGVNAERERIIVIQQPSAQAPAPKGLWSTITEWWTGLTPLGKAGVILGGAGATWAAGTGVKRLLDRQRDDRDDTDDPSYDYDRRNDD